MYLSKRAAFIRNVAVASVNGVITLVLLLIAPLGLAAVIANTFLVTFSTFLVCSASDFVVAWLSLSSSSGRFIHYQGELSRWQKPQQIERKRYDQQ